MKKLLLSGLSLLFSIGAVAKQNVNIIPPIYSVVDLKSGSFLEQNNEKKIHSIASLTKLMTAYVLQRNHPDLNSCIAKITDEDKDWLKNTGTRIEKDKNMSCKKLMQIMLVMSDNWAASALTKTIPGVSSDNFIRLMNLQAKEWGMGSTFFKDSSGLSPQNVSTAYDMSILSWHISQVPLINALTSQKELVVIKDTGKYVFYSNTNKLVRENIVTSRLSKTGYIKESGYNLVFVPDNCSKEIAIVIMGAQSSIRRANFAEKLLDKYQCH